jgi:hypothetical protein
MGISDSIHSLPYRTLILPCVRFTEINIYLLTIMEVMAAVSSDHGVAPIITGVTGEDIYPVGGAHRANRAIDYRSAIYGKPMVVAQDLQKRFNTIDPGFTVLYHDSGNGMHYHIQYKK